MNRTLWAGIVMTGFLFIVAAAAPLIATHDYKEQRLADKLRGPCAEYILGTDELGRDVFSRLVYGSRISMSVGIIAVFIAAAIGIFMGSAAGYYGGWIDNMIMRIVDIFLSIPTIYLILTTIVFLGPSIINVMIVIGLTGWTGIARLVRAEVLKNKNMKYVDSAKLIGLPESKIIMRHLLPNSLTPVFVAMTFGIAGAIFTEAALSFLGLGVQPPLPSWGNMLTAGKDYMHSAWWLIVFPGIAIFTAVFSYNLLGEGLRDYMNPVTRREDVG